jgi:hypothetical protein
VLAAVADTAASLLLAVLLMFEGADRPAAATALHSSQAAAIIAAIRQRPAHLAAVVALPQHLARHCC